ncbi:isoleucine--tRNA ligase [Parvularcula sp. ZS-1/3]|uniref:Isoleucine--tRNA ligase n=1 Tax=Parvularcula mediterranea TaxID=2732508 RepID=A0A7Y3W5L1_9PROT|nr:isoleucine--tRNA ligase [Parvularcula mediterranea]NNU16734.1 isoleucine--tRNA ligase [Parvularcula mediterranea]
MADDQRSKNDYKDTLFLPATDFPMRGGLPKKEPQMITRWDEMGLYAMLRADAKDREKFVLHDGPPYANGHLHMGTALNKTIKDLIVRTRQMAGFDANYVPGWDCHGLPIEWKVEEAFRGKGRKKGDVPPSEFREECRAYAAKWIDIQRTEFKRLGIEGDWWNPYKTMDFTTEAAIVREFLTFVEKGLVYRGSKPIMWSPVEQTALAEAEIEYHDHQSTTIWVKFPFVQAPEGLEGAQVVIWTTTPWTIPANRAVCYGEGISYGLYEVESVRQDLEFAPFAAPGDRLILADSLAEEVFGAAFVDTFKRIEDVPATKLSGAKLKHPLNGHADSYDFDVHMLSGDHVTDDAGTGFVHTAPSHGQEDYFAWLGAGLPLDAIPYTVGPDGAYTDEAPGFEGRQVFRTEGKKAGKDGDANPEVIKALVEKGSLLARGRLKHSYPHSWRSKAPVLFRNTPQWFIRVGQGEGSLRETALKAIDETTFYPPSGVNRLRGMVEQRPDWLVSRQRAWGVPITLFVDKSGEPLVDEAVNKRIYDAVAEKGADAWFDTPDAEFLGDKYDPADFEKVTDILDVWFDSGCTHAFTLEDRDDLQWPADLYMEGSDQHRGWFQSSLLEGCGTRGRAPYKAIFTHGFVLDDKGLKMSKSLGNVMLPEQVTQKFGADILRIWVASSDVQEDIRVGDEILGSAVDAYRKLRNTLRYLLSGLDGYTEEERVDVADMPELERYILHRLHEVNEKIRASFDAYNFKAAWRALSEFAIQDLSAFYFDIRKDCLYCDAPSSLKRRANRTVMAILLDHLVRLLAPVCPFTAEEVYDHFPAGLGEKKPSVHLLQFADVPGSYRDEALAERWQKLRGIRRVITGAIEEKRNEKLIGASLEAASGVVIDDPALADLAASVDLAELSITSQATLANGQAPDGAHRLPDQPNVAVSISKAAGEKCGRCWRVLPDVPEDGALCGRCADATK